MAKFKVGDTVVLARGEEDPVYQYGNKYEVVSVDMSCMFYTFKDLTFGQIRYVGFEHEHEFDLVTEPAPQHLPDSYYIHLGAMYAPQVALLLEKLEGDGVLVKDYDRYGYIVVQNNKATSTPEKPEHLLQVNASFDVILTVDDSIELFGKKYKRSEVEAMLANLQEIKG